MTLQDAMAADLSRTFLSAGEFAFSAEFYPDGAAAHFTCTVAPADLSEQFAQIGTGEADERVVQFTARLSALRAGILAVPLTARDPRRGDLLVVAATGYVGTWAVQTIAPDIGDGVVLTARWSKRQIIAGRGATEVR